MLHLLLGSLLEGQFVYIIIETIIIIKLLITVNSNVHCFSFKTCVLSGCTRSWTHPCSRRNG